MGYPIYIPSKGRADTRLTMRSLDALSIPYRVVIQPQSEAEYRAHFRDDQLLVLPFNDNEEGLLRARNWIMEHSIAEGHKRHWQLDDNIRGFYRIYDSHSVRVREPMSPTLFEQVESHTDQFENVAQSGLQYDMFRMQGAMTRPWTRPYDLNSRIYSCTLNNNAIPFRYRIRYNDDTDMSLQCLKAGWCTILYRCFTCGKVRTMRVGGGNTDRLYRQESGYDGRLEMAKQLQQWHPDVTKITWKFGRWQHQVDYRAFKSNQLRYCEDELRRRAVQDCGAGAGLLTHHRQLAQERI